MGSRLDLQNKLEEKLGSDHVYFQPPASIKMEYTAIKFSKTKKDAKYANDSRYINLTRYELIVIAKKPDDPVIEKLLGMPYCSYDRAYKIDNLYHDVLTLYY